MARSNNVKPETRALIVNTGRKLQGIKIAKDDLELQSSPKIKYCDIQRAIGTNHSESHNELLGIKCVKRWWDEREVFDLTGSLQHKPRSGRPIHPAFATQQKKEEVIEFACNMGLGYHRQDVMDEFGIKSHHTLKKHTGDEIEWVLSPGQHANDNADVKRKRVDYAEHVLTRTGQLRRKFKNATWIDHKKVCFYGLNKSHWKQAKRKGQDKSNMETISYEHNNPYLMTYFAGNRNGVACFTHANKRRKKRGSGYMCDTWKINADDVIEAFDGEFIDFMNVTDSDYVIADGVRLQHTQEVRDHLNDHDIDLHPSACLPHDRQDGYPPYSHPCMIHDHRAFAPLQKDIAIECKDNYDGSNGDTKQAFLFDIITDIWESDKYIDICSKAIDDYADTMHQIIEKEGNISTIK